MSDILNDQQRERAVEAKLRAPLEITLGADGIQRLYTASGVLNAETVRELLS